jgi:hypothetical protein
VKLLESNWRPLKQAFKIAARPRFSWLSPQMLFVSPYVLGENGD